MSNAVPLIVIGDVALLGGVLIVIFRRRIRDLTVDEEKTLFGQQVGETAGKVQSPFWVGAAGAGGAVLGVIMIVAGATFLLSS